MSSSSISHVSDLVAVIRMQLSASARGGVERRGADRKTARPDKTADRNLAGLIEVRVRSIARDDPQRGRKAFTVFLELVLLSHFGEGLVNNARFHQMVRDVQQAMEADARCRELIARAIDHLLGDSQ